MNFFLLISAAFVNVGLRPVVAVSVLLYADGEQLHVRGAIQISLPLDPGMRLRAADTLPAWAFNLKTGKKLPHVVPRFFYLLHQMFNWLYEAQYQQNKLRFVFSEGAWENQGLGIVKTVGGELVWTYTASHLGHWIAAPLPSPDGTQLSCLI